MSGIILYKSKYGATRKYAEWLSERTGFSYIETDKSDIKVISGYDVIILGGGIYASGIAGLSFLKKNIEKLKGAHSCQFGNCSVIIRILFRYYPDKNCRRICLPVDNTSGCLVSSSA